MQLSIQRTHIHLLVEADHKEALAAGMQGVQISGREAPECGDRQSPPGIAPAWVVFPAEAITSPRQARRALGYVMFNRANPTRIRSLR